MPCGRTRSVGSGEPPGHEDRLAVGALLGPERQPVQVVVLVEVVGVDGRRALLRLERLQRLGRLVAPRLLALELAGLAGARLERGRAAPRSSGPRSAMSPTTNGASPGRAANRSPGIVPVRHPPRRPARGTLAAGSAAGLAPATGRAGPVARSEPAALRLAEAAAVRADPSPRQPGSIRHGEPAPTRPANRSARAARAATAAAGPATDGRPPRPASAARARARRRAAARRRSPRRRVDRHPVAVLDLDDHVERGRCLALQDALLGPPAAGLLVAQGDALDAADEVGQRRVEHQVVEVVAVRRADELDAALGDGARRGRLQLGADLVDDDDLGHVVLDRLDHHVVLVGRRADLHPARPADGRVRDVAVARDLVGRVHDDDALVQVVREHAGGLAQHRGLADARAAHDEHRLPGLDQVVDDLDGAEDGAPDAAGQADDLAAAVADGGDAVERPLDARAVVVAERADVLDHGLDVGLGDLAVEQDDLAPGKRASGRRPRSITTSMTSRSGSARTARRSPAAARRAARRCRRWSRASSSAQRSSVRVTASGRGRHEGRFGDAHERLLHQQRHLGDRSNPASSSRRSSGDS